MPQRNDDAVQFYRLLERAEQNMGGRRLLGSLTGRLSLPPRGVYFFFDSNEKRTSTGTGSRVVRIGTHALTTNSRSTLGGRLKQHRGTVKDAGGNHRGSVFRLLVGKAIIAREGIVQLETWGVKSSADKATRALERDMEGRVSSYLAGLEVVWLAVSDTPSRDSQRGIIERGSIALLSNLGKSTIDPASAAWLGLSSTSEKVRLSGLWNQNHVHEDFDSKFFGCFEQAIMQHGSQ